MRSSRRSNDLMDAIASTGNLHLAWRAVKRKGGQPGGDDISTAIFERDLTQHLKRLQQELRAGRYQPRPVRFFQMSKEDGGVRLIGILSVRDRVVQRAFLNVLNPFYEKRFLPCSYGYRQGRGIHDALQHVMNLYSQGFAWIVDCDIETCFDSISHARLKRIFQKDLPDKRVCRVLAIWLAACTLPHNHRTRRGILQGAVLSPLMANVYLHPFDEEMTRRRKRQLVRYADDLLVLCRTRQEAGNSFSFFSLLLKDNMGFRHRIKHPPPDPINILLSLGYTLLFNHMHAMVNLVGLDPYRGFFHQDKRGHAALVSDLIEEYRSPVIDRLVLRCVNLGTIKRRDFEKRKDKVSLKKEGLKKFLEACDQRFNGFSGKIIDGRRTTFRHLFEHQCRHIARVVVGREQRYQPFYE